MNPLESTLIYEEPLYRIPEKVLVVIPERWDSMEDSEKLLLSKILASVKLSLEGIVVVSRPVELEKLVPTLKPIAIISFDPETNGGQEPYAPGTYQGVPFLAGDSLSVLSDEKKKLLWNALKKLFLTA